MAAAAAFLSSHRLIPDLAAGGSGSACEAGVASPDASAAASKSEQEMSSPFRVAPLGARADSPQPPAPDFFRFLLISSEALLALSCNSSQNRFHEDKTPVQPKLPNLEDDRTKQIPHIYTGRRLREFHSLL